jgi:hypothetical protein
LTDKWPAPSVEGQRIVLAIVDSSQRVPQRLSVEHAREAVSQPLLAADTMMDDEETFGIVFPLHRGKPRVVRAPM